MYRILSVSFGSSDLDYDLETRFLGKRIRVERRGVNGQLRAAHELVEQADGRYDVIGLGGMGLRFRVGETDWIHHETHELARRVTRSALTDGRRVKTTLGKWAVRDTNRRFDGLFSNASTLFLSGINYYAIAKVVAEYTDRIRFADPVTQFGFPYTLGSHRELEWYATFAMPVLTRYSYTSFFPGRSLKDEWRHVLLARAVDEAEVVVGDQLAIRHYTPYHLRNKVLVTDSVDELFLDEMKSRGVRMIVSLLPQLFERPVNDNVFEGMIVCALGKDPNALVDDDFLQLFERIELTPHVSYPQGRPVHVHKFAFVIHPLARRYLYKAPLLRWLESAPQPVQIGFEKALAYSPAFVYSKVTGIKSPTGDEAEGHLIALGATPEEMVSRSPEFTYSRLVAASRMAKKLGARLMGLGAFTKIVGDAGITVAKRADLPITSGNSYTASATLWAAKEASVKMGLELDDRGRAIGKAMVVGATGSIGSVSARLLALAFPEVVLVAPRADKLLELKQEVESQSPDCEVTVATRPDPHLSDVDLIVTTTSARGANVLDMMKVKPGAVICDCARPLDIGPEEARKRPDVLVVESGEIELPGEVDFGGDIGLPPKVAYACLAETVVLALEGRYENFTLGRNIEIDKVKEIYKLGLKHGCKLAAIRGPFGVYDDKMIAEVRARAEQARRSWQGGANGSAAEPDAGVTNGGNGRGGPSVELVMRRLRSRFRRERVERETSYLVKLGERSDGTWTLVLSPSRVSIRKGKRVAEPDCELRTSPDLFRRMVLEGYAPRRVDFSEGRVETNAPDLLDDLRAGFGAEEG